MRRGVLILILAVACASSDTKKNSLRIDVVEQRGQRFTMTGQHAYMVRVTNTSPGPVELESIHLKPAGVTDFTFEDEMLTVGDILSYGETREYPMFVTIVPEKGGSSSQFTANLNSVSVTIACRSESGTFVVSDVVPIQARS
jgi:hypothetical protein